MASATELTDAQALKLDQDLQQLQASIATVLSLCSKAHVSDQATFKDNHNHALSGLSRFRKKLHELELLAEEQDTEEETEAVTNRLRLHQNTYQSLQKGIRDSTLQARRNAEKTALEDRKALLSGGKAKQRQRELQNESDFVSTAEGITTGLQRTRQLLAQELEHTSGTLASMEASHDRLKQTRDEYRGQRGKIKQSSRLLTVMKLEHMKEWGSLYVGLAIFLLVVAYVLQKRARYFVPSAFSFWPAGSSGNKTQSGQVVRLGAGSPIPDSRTDPLQKPTKGLDAQTAELASGPAAPAVPFLQTPAEQDTRVVLLGETTIPKETSQADHDPSSNLESSDQGECAAPVSAEVRKEEGEEAKLGPPHQGKPQQEDIPASSRQAQLHENFTATKGAADVKVEELEEVRRVPVSGDEVANAEPIAEAHGDADTLDAVVNCTNRAAQLSGGESKHSEGKVSNGDQNGEGALRYAPEDSAEPEEIGQELGDEDPDVGVQDDWPTTTSAANNASIDNGLGAGVGAGMGADPSESPVESTADPDDAVVHQEYETLLPPVKQDASLPVEPVLQADVMQNPDGAGTMEPPSDVHASESLSVAA